MFEDLEIRFLSGQKPVVLKKNEIVLEIEVVFWQNTCEGMIFSNGYLYFKDTATSLVRVEMKDIRQQIEAGGKSVQPKEISKDVESYFALASSYWILNKNGEIQSYGPVTAILKLGPTIKITSTSVIAPLGYNLLVCWHSLAANKNHFVYFSKQMEYFSSLSIDVKESSASLTKINE